MNGTLLPGVHIGQQLTDTSVPRHFSTGAASLNVQTDSSAISTKLSCKFLWYVACNTFSKTHYTLRVLYW